MKLKRWEDNHNCCITDMGAIGGKLSYKFTPTSIGTVKIVKCACSKEIDLSNYTNW
ncbi:MAG: hypothetical protein HQ521_06690 [Bacteroidetes bacterium]|nr:hypothetical protein [Bacteroidota bacterium]